MKVTKNKDEEQQSLAVGNEMAAPVAENLETEHLDNSPEAIEARKLQDVADNSSEALEMQAYQENINYNDADDAPNAEKKNTTGIPDNIKDGIEQLSGISLDDVTVHYNSSKPAEVGADAYAEGTDVYIGPGQEEHLPHELWHVIQQKQGKVKATTKVNGKNVDDRESMEDDATKEGGKALKMKKQDKDSSEEVLDTSPLNGSKTVQRKIKIGDDVYNGWDELERLQKDYHEDVYPNIVNEIPEAVGVDGIKEVLDHKDTFELVPEKEVTAYPNGYRTRAWELTNTIIGETDGNVEQDAGEKGALVERPEEGFSALKIAGLIQCVGIVIEAKNDDGEVVAAVGGHFVTPGSIDDGSINERGMAMINGLRELISKYNGLTFSVQTMVALGKMEGADKSGDYLSGQAAELLIREELDMDGECNVGGPKRLYKLNADGTSSLE
jgi:hypothetical protein